MSEPMSLDGTWDFFAGDHRLDDLDALEAEPIRVPGLWEAQGHLELDGVAWYRRRFRLDDAGDCWSLRFGAVMDMADVWLNGIHVGSHESAFTPFELDVTHAVVAGENTLAVRVVDPPLGDADHARSAHGKQGWANDSFPSRPSLYLTYGGIWQPVTLHRHGPVVVRDVFVNGDPGDLVVRLDACNRSSSPQRPRIRVTALGEERETEVDLRPGERRALAFSFGPTDAPCWSPDAPVLHEAVVEALGSDAQSVRYGLRTIRVDGRRALVDGMPYRMRGVLVQGFRAEELYAEGDREAIREEVLSAKAMGFNTVRLHVKAFDPAYLDVCDEVGMYAYCDLPVAEPVAYDELRAGSTLARRCVAAAREQVLRDRNHPSIVLWAAMNEIGDLDEAVRRSPGYEEFARLLYATVRAADPTRPVIENDWPEPDPERVFCSPILTAHWYGRLHRRWLDELDGLLARHADLDRVVLVSEYGDWGLPDMPDVPEPPFWDAREAWSAALALALWPGSVESFCASTQRYQGLSDRLQTELIRRHGGVSGYCLTELTDVPHELNGLLDVHRRPKEPAVAEMTRANQVVLPVLDLRTLAAEAGGRLRVGLHVVNDGPALADVEVEVDGEHIRVGELAAYAPTHLGDVTIALPPSPGPHGVGLRLRSRGALLAENAYPLRLVAPSPAEVDVRLVGDEPAAAALLAVGARVGARGPLVVAEGALDRSTLARVREHLHAGGTAVVLAQPADAACSYPVEFEFAGADTSIGPGFPFTTDDTLTAFPPRRMLAGEDATIRARSLAVRVDGARFPKRPLVARHWAHGSTGTVVGVHPVAAGRLVFCQFALADAVGAGDPVARALLADLLRLAACRRRRGGN
ncbi:MAG: hypothetical protein ICV64_07950 [Thermoleophilia bacterium]|nr:hypothetical protein [Thermoleophilia bacterium]